MVTPLLALPRSLSSMRRWPPTLLCLPLLAALAVLAAGCGGTSNSATPATAAGSAPTGTSTTGGFRRVANAKFTACLKAQGVTLPSRGFFRPRSDNGTTTGQTPTTPPPGGGGRGAFNDPKTRAAFEKCRQYLPNGGQFGGGGRPGVNSAVFAKYRQCLTSHGIKLTGSGPFGGADVASPAFQKAAKACRAYAPRFGGAPPPGTGSTATTP